MKWSPPPGLARDEGVVVRAALGVCLLAALTIAGSARADMFGKSDIEVKPTRTEVMVVPAIGYNTDLGLGLGATAVIARFKPGAYPYHWRIETSVNVRMKPQYGKVRFPFLVGSFQLARPGLLDGKARMRIEAVVVHRSNIGYYGMGNASVEETPWEGIDREVDLEAYENAIQRNQYSRTTAQLQSDLWFDGPRSLRAFAGGRFSWNWTTVYEGSVLADDLAGASGQKVQEMLVGAGRYGQLLGFGGIMWDTRDHEFAPSRGVFHDLSIRGGPVFGEQGGFVAFNASLRFFVPVWKDNIVFAARLMGDLIVGPAPFYELVWYGGVYPAPGPGGGTGVRGVPEMRYHGKAKVIGSLELRHQIVRFKLFKQPTRLGGVVFVDTGRVWTDLTSQPGLDGGGFGLKVGLGGGPRLQIGETFLVRADFAYSPDGFGVYLTLGNTF